MEKGELVRAMLQTVPQQVDNSAFFDLPREPREELPTKGAAAVEGERLGGLRLGLAEEGAQLGEVHRELAVVIVR